MTVKDIDVSAALDRARSYMKRSKDMPDETKAILELLITIITLMMGMLKLNSKNSSQPPSKDKPGTKTKKTKSKGKKRKPGAQRGHKGANLEPVLEPDEIEEIKIDRRTLPSGTYTPVGFDTRQVFDVKISTFVTEYRAEILEDEEGNQFVADFPDDVKTKTQYGASVKAQSTYMSIWQLVPLARVHEFFRSQFEMTVSKGSVNNFNNKAFELLEPFEKWAKDQLIQSSLLHADETGVNVDGKSHWLHCLGNDRLSLFHVDPKRGKAAMDNMDVLPHFTGKLVHDHWKSYYLFDCVHCLCNAHHLRELTWSHEVDEKEWAGKMLDLLNKMNDATNESGGVLSQKEFKEFLRKYRSILKAGHKECPRAEKKEGQRGRTKQTKSRNLLDRLSGYEQDVLRFATEKEVPFTNNAGENDIRMTKVQQKISGCFRSLQGARVFCRVRSFLLTCQKQQENPFECLTGIFEGRFPDFMK